MFFWIKELRGVRSGGGMGKTAPWTINAIMQSVRKFDLLIRDTLKNTKLAFYEMLSLFKLNIGHRNLFAKINIFLLHLSSRVLNCTFNEERGLGREGMGRGK